jgi:hypothetical protein
VTRKQILSLTRGDPELRTVLLRQKYAPRGQKEKRNRDLVRLNASRLAASMTPQHPSRAAWKAS